MCATTSRSRHKYTHKNTEKGEIPIGCILELLFGLLLLAVLALVAWTVSLAVVKAQSPEAFHKYLTERLGGLSYNFVTLDSESMLKLEELGYNPYLVAADAKAQRWIKETYGVLIDLGMSQSIHQYEWNFGKNPGPWEAIDRACRYSIQECAAAKWLLNHMKEYGVKSLYLSENYDNYRGAGAGEFGPGLLPSTAVKICQALQEHTDEQIRSCNFFDPISGAPSAGVYWWLTAIKYETGLADPEKFQSLWGWNHDSEYRWTLIERSKEINTELEALTLDEAEIWESDYSVFNGGWFQKLLLKWLALEFWSLIPDNFITGLPPSGGDLPPQSWTGYVHPYPGGFLCGYFYGSWGGRHKGIDICRGQPWGSFPIYAMHSGEIAFAEYLPASDYRAGIWWVSGNVVWIKGKNDNGDVVETCYGHGENTPDVKVGNQVKAGTKLMMSGTTGFSSGIHLHLCMKINGDWVNPTQYIPWSGD